MEFDNTFAVTAPVAEVWDAVLDVERVAPCMPGAQVLERTDDDAYKVAIKVKLGPISMLYKGDVEILERDVDAHRATMRAKATEARGQGTAQADILMTLAEQGAQTEATIHTEMQLSGRAAAMGQGVIKDVAAALVATFAENLAGSLSAGGEQEPTVEAGGNGPPSAAQEPRPTPPPATEAEPSLPVGQIVAGVVGARLKQGRTRALVSAVLALLVFAIARRVLRRAR